MSETDSENEYESAGEDAEDCVLKEEESVSVNDLTAAVKTELTVKDVDDTVTTSVAVKDVKTVTTSVTVKDNDTVMTSVTVKDDDTVTTVETSDKQNEFIERTPELLQLNTDTECEKNLPENKSDVRESDLKRTSSQSSETKQIESVISSQPKRVTLRLERKLQERSQQTSTIDSKKDESKVDEKSASSWGFSSWGSSLLSSAASSVTTFTSQVSQGIGTVIETVESSLGAPPPEDLASILHEKREKEHSEAEEYENVEEHEISEESPGEEPVDEEGGSSIPAASMLITGVTSLTKVVGDTGSKVLMGGLDTLEMIGKKTYDILTEGDPGLRKKRSALSGITLSQILREARDKAEEEQANSTSKDQEEVVHYSQAFDEYQGLVHLEALEMLSDQCQSAVQRALLMITDDSTEKQAIEKVSRICEDLPSETPDEEIEQDFEAAISEHLNALQLKISLEKIKMVHNTINDWLTGCLTGQEKGRGKEAKEIHRQAISSLADFTARCVEQFHKFGELIMVQSDADFDVVMCATHLTGLTSVLCLEISLLASRFCLCLNTAADDSEDPDSITPLITSVYLEASNSTTYVQDAFQLLIPVLQTSLLP